MWNYDQCELVYELEVCCIVVRGSIPLHVTDQINFYMKFKIKTIDYGNGEVRYIILKKNWLGFYTKLYYRIDGYNIFSWNDVCMNNFSKKILYLTYSRFGECINIKHKFSYSLLNYFTNLEAAKYFIDLAIQYGKKRKKITYEKYP